MKLFLVGVLLSIVGCPRVCLAEDATPPSVKCGAYSVFIGLKALGLVDGPYSAFEQTIPAPGPSGYSMEDLERIASGRGASTLAVEADLEVLATLSRPNACIGFLDKHFAIIKWVNVDTKMVSLIDPPREYDQPFGDFRKRYSGRCLVLGLPSIPPKLAGPTRWASILGWTSAVAALALLGGILARGSRRRVASALLLVSLLALAGCETQATPTPKPTPVSHLGLKVEPAEYHLGKVFASKPDQTLTLENRLVNESASTIRVLEVKKSCTCTGTSLESSSIPAGGSTTLKSIFTLGSRPGPNRVTVELVVGVPDPTSHVISFDWDVVTPMFADALSLDFGRLEPDQSGQRRIGLMDRGLVICPDCRLDADPNHGQIGAEARIERDSELAGHVAESEAPAPERPLGSLIVSIRSGGEPGVYHQGISLVLRCRGVDRAKLDLPVDWTIRPSVEAQPSRLWLGSRRAGASISKRIAVRSNDGTPLRIERVLSDPPEFVAESKVSARSDHESDVDLTFVPQGNPGLHRVSVIIAHAEGGDSTAGRAGLLSRRADEPDERGSLNGRSGGVQWGRSGPSR